MHNSLILNPDYTLWSYVSRCMYEPGPAVLNYTVVEDFNVPEVLPIKPEIEGAVALLELTPKGIEAAKRVYRNHFSDKQTSIFEVLPGAKCIYPAGRAVVSLVLSHMVGALLPCVIGDLYYGLGEKSSMEDFEAYFKLSCEEALNMGEELQNQDFITIAALEFNWSTVIPNENMRDLCKVVVLETIINREREFPLFNDFIKNIIDPVLNNQINIEKLEYTASSSFCTANNPEVLSSVVNFFA